MATSAFRQISLLPSLIISSFLFTATISEQAKAESVNVPAKGMQLAWYGGHGWGGWGHHGWGGWGHRGWGGFGYAPIGLGLGFGGFPGYYGGFGPGWGGWGPGYNYVNWGPSYYVGCQKRCFVNRWNRLICSTSCY
ncbi:hypothetical protein ACNVED_04545 [Legionella sp. D16C41]|uniref:hypothetical protein n=1 Tax=Legionella sp. D16C41 TaxID=3402688 RepID=UPI003AF41698